MNRENVIKLRDFLLSIPETSFRMDTWNFKRDIHPCQTACCVGGWAAVLSYNEGNTNGEDVFFPWYSDDRFSAEWLGLTPAQKEAMFYPDEWSLNDEYYGNPYSIKSAVAMLNHFLETDEVVWIKDN